MKAYRFSFLSHQVRSIDILAEKEYNYQYEKGQIVLSGGRTISYEYDEEERITKVTDSEVGTTLYTYDALGQLLTETLDGTVVNTMTYDNYGNILTKNGVQYTYGDTAWKDKLTGVGTKTIVYDEQGNPTNYLGHNLTWEKGRQLKSFDGNTYTYNANGIRTSKTVDGVRHDFVLDGAKILREAWNFDESAKIYCDILVPLYDNEDSVCGIIYNDEPYYFQKNLQGDIIGMVDKDSTVVARYSYDAWGVPTITEDSTNCNIATTNPFRYRGYYFDSEINLYYLQSRYYDAEVGRFINGDKADSTVVICNILANNSFSYCGNNIVNELDKDGNVVISIIKKFLVGVLKGFFKQICIDFIEWLFKKLIRKYKGAFKFSPIEDYVASILSAIVSEFNPTNLIGTTFAIVCLFIKYIPKLISRRMTKKDWLNLLLDIVDVILSAILKNYLKKLKNKRRQIHEKMLSGETPNLLRIDGKRINIRIYYVGLTLEFNFPISKQLVSTLINILF